MEYRPSVLQRDTACDVIIVISVILLWLYILPHRRQFTLDWGSRSGQRRFVYLFLKAEMTAGPWTVTVKEF